MDNQIGLKNNQQKLLSSSFFEEGNETDETEYISPDVYEIEDFIISIKQAAKNLIPFVQKDH